MREEIINVLKTYNRKMNAKEILDAIKGDGNSEELRDLIDELDSMISDGILRTASGNTYFFSDLISGILDVHSTGSAHLLMGDTEDIFIKKHNLKGACDKDTVSVEIINEKTNEGKVVKVLKRSLGRSLAEIVNKNGVLSVDVLDKSLPYKVEVMDSDLNLVDGMIVHLVYVKDIDKNRVLAKIDKVITHKNAPGKESQIAMVASEFNRSMYFPEDVLEEGKSFRTFLTPEEVEEGLKQGRVDLRGETITTTDGKDTKDIDDAINTIVLPNGNYLETVAIADVSHYVKMGSAMWKYAEMKGNSDYWGNKVAPMLPVELSNGICSLNPNEDKFAVCVQYELDHAGNKLNSNVFLAVIKSKAAINYDAVQDFIKGKETEDTAPYSTVKYTVKDNETVEDIAFKYAMTKDELLEYNKEEDFVSGKEINIPVRKLVQNHYITSKIMQDALMRRGKTDFDGREVKFIFDENDKVIGAEPRVQREAERIIEHKMIYANEAFAEFMSDKLSKITQNLIPFVFRTHGSPNPKKIQEFLDMLSVYGIDLGMNIDPENISSKQIEEILDKLRDKSYFSAFSDKLLRCMQKAQYTVENYGHYAIASDCYTHFTSPIRRMCDLLVHTIFKVFVVEEKHDTQTLRFWGDYLNKICEQISQCEVDAEKCEYAMDDMFGAELMLDNIGKQYEGIVDGMLPGSFFVRTDDFIEGRVEFYLDEDDANELLNMTDKNEIEAYVENHKKFFSGTYDYNEKLYGYSKNGRMYLRYGDRVLVSCIGADPDKREIDFALIKKL